MIIVLIIVMIIVLIIALIIALIIVLIIVLIMLRITLLFNILKINKNIIEEKINMVFSIGDVYTPMFNEATTRAKLKVQNIHVPGADYILLYFSNETFWVDNVNETTFFDDSSSVAWFGAGNLTEATQNMPKGTKKQFLAEIDFGDKGEVVVLIEGDSAFGAYVYLVSKFIYFNYAKN